MIEDLKILIIDSHKSTDNSDQQNLHWKNAKILADELDADLIWSYPTVNDDIKDIYDVIIFNHASRYSYVDNLWLHQNPNAKIFFITNEYNLGEPSALWPIAKAGRHYNVISNHHAKISKVVKKYVTDWHLVNLNALVFNPFARPENFFSEYFDKENIIYYGSFRKGRINSFKKYLQDEVVLSTHHSNISKFREIQCNANVCNRIDWPNKGVGLDNFKFSLYIEDEVNHENYNHLANRFYEALNHDVLTLFDVSCKKNLELSGYKIPDHLIVDGYCDMVDKVKNIDDLFIENILVEWKEKATRERVETITQIKSIITQ